MLDHSPERLLTDAAHLRALAESAEDDAHRDAYIRMAVELERRSRSAWPIAKAARAES